MSTSSNPSPLPKRLHLKPDATVAFWPEVNDLPSAVQDFASDHTTVATIDEADFVAVNAPDHATATKFLDSQLTNLAETPAVWLIYPKGNRTDINRDSLWTLLAEYGWRAVSNISIDDTNSSIRIRPLKPGEEPRTLEK
ncbi:MAG: hypothetical protein ACTHXA_10170 [Gulosibacter sp.]|uniref:hypothetical protein n=1 Tax=Gulosibacter sp. TaxID=2817531 RepID=UPI003F8F1081